MYLPSDIHLENLTEAGQSLVREAYNRFGYHSAHAVLALVNTTNQLAHLKKHEDPRYHSPIVTPHGIYPLRLVA